MKNFKLIIAVLILATISYSCNNSAVQRMSEKINPEEPERAVGMSDWAGVEDMKWHIGTQDAVDVAKNMDSAWKAKDYETMRTFISDTATITATNGFTFDSPDEFIESRKRRDSVITSNGATFDWKFTNLFSVDLDPTTGGEHVHVDYYGMYTKDGKEDNFRVMNRYYVIDGKIVVWNSYSQEIIEPKEETEEE
ncbi:MAG: nuclear transport factor 2 family protein [Flavobacteriaceae bacterium]|jgi:hypothetical protein|nr:nuclear transport factor 2 family protein [Flavobacteriaceae bacterium]MBT4112586.1 nuclear transport factor 2 family protein [Flavobacteriaceae bacterium]MBT4614440.1 nuclear transport factor 2 family protein [Flavobacteriaceae bacterium]MBT5246893.1 nuclear transport factor 2 family protein [Flavobacteriaceae bacterium]MBT5650078.1 nuclear transport factor 2 family protein [Flavobacteriaceae bacterium]